MERCLPTKPAHLHEVMSVNPAPQGSMKPAIRELAYIIASPFFKAFPLWIHAVNPCQSHDGLLASARKPTAPNCEHCHQPVKLVLRRSTEPQHGHARAATEAAVVAR